jgi:hypothetical protein
MPPLPTRVEALDALRHSHHLMLYKLLELEFIELETKTVEELENTGVEAGAVDVEANHKLAADARKLLAIVRSNRGAR